MSGYDRQIAYISWYENGVKRGNAGFVKWESDQFKHALEIHIKGLYETDMGELLIKTKNGRLIDTILLNKGRGECKQQESGATMGIDNIPIEELNSITASLPGNRYLEASWINHLNKQTVSRKPLETNRTNSIFSQEKITTEQEETTNEGRTETVESMEQAEPLKLDTLQEEQIKKEAITLKSCEKLLQYGSKWEQLQDMFDTITPFSDGRTFIRFAPKDFYILHESCQPLAHNSFLLHGYYNYQYLILGKKNEEEKYLLGVPGVYYEREIMAARMFGFEGFEGADGKSEPGSFGYYMVSVE